MKFLCGNCKAKYQIPDEKVVGRTLRMKCRRCNHDILIDGHAMPTAASGQGAPARRPGGSSVSVMPPGAMRSGSGAGPLPARPAPPVPGVARSKPPPSALNADFRRHVAAPPAVPGRSAPYDLWHVAIQDVPVGPMTRDELSRKIEASAVNAQSLCWREGMDDWRPMGELAELAALLRRSMIPPTGRGSVRPQGRVPPAVPGPVGARPPSLYSFDELEDEGSEPTRIADMTGGHPVAAGATAQRAAGASSQPRLPAFGNAAAAATGPAAEPAMRATQQRQGMSSAALITLGLLLGIVVVGGPMIVRTFWFTPSAPPAQAAVVGTVAPKVQEERAARDVDVSALPVETPEEADKGQAKTAGKPGVGARNTKPGAGEKPKDGAKDNLSEAERALLARMGGGDTAIPNVGRDQAVGSGGKTASGPALTASQLMKVVQDNRPALQRCYETALRSSGGKSDEAVKVTVEVVVGMSGTVKSVETRGQGIGNMNDCLRQSVKRWRFPQSGDESPFAFPVVFQPGS